jgi:nucleoside-diphosphate-sugar epimerase
VIVTGGSVGIGKAVALALELAREGVDVAICARGQERLEAAASELSAETGRRVIPVAADTTDRVSVERLAQAAFDAFGRIGILVNNAAFPGGLVRGVLAEADEQVAISAGSTVAEASRQTGVTQQTFYRWRTEYGGLKIDQARRLKQLETENGRLRRAVADLTLDNQILREAAEGNF